MKEKQKRVMALAGVLLCGAFSFSALGCVGHTGHISASAGISEGVLVDANSFAGSAINSGSWNVVGGVTAKGGKLRWTEEAGTGEDYVIAKSKIRDNSEWGLERFLKITASVNLRSMADDARFVFAVGLPERNSALGEDGSYELVFTKDGEAPEVAFVGYENGNAVYLADKTVRSDLIFDKKMNFEMEIGYDKTISVTLNKQPLFTNVEMDAVPEGFFAIGQSGGICVVNVPALEVNTTQYFAPENGGTQTETFDNGEYNANAWYSCSEMSAFTPTGLTVRDGKLRFENSGSAYFVTRHRYSNFELTFDLLDYQNEAVYDDDGNFVIGYSSGLHVFFGGPKIEEILSESILFTNYRFGINGRNYGEDTRLKPNGTYTVQYTNKTMYENVGMASTGVDPWDRELSFDEELGRNKMINIRVVVEDMQASFYAQYADRDADGNEIPATEAEWGDPIISAVLPETPTGYVRIGSYAEGPVHEKGVEFTEAGNFSIDNVTIRNLDKEDLKQEISLGFKSNVTEPTKDFKYTDRDDAKDLLQNKLAAGEKASGCSGNTGVIASALTVFGCAAELLRNRRKKAQGGKR